MATTATDPGEQKVERSKRAAAQLRNDVSNYVAVGPGAAMCPWQDEYVRSGKAW